MKKIYLLILALAFCTTGFAQIVIDNPTFTNGNNGGWTPVTVTFPTTPAPGYALFTANGTAGNSATGSRLTSPSFSVSSYGSIVLSFDAEKLDNGSGEITVEYSINGAAYVNAPTITLPNPDGTFDNYSISISNPGTNIQIRFKKTGGNRDIGLRNVVITGNCFSTANPQAFTATTISASQINLGYTANADNNNTVIVFNTTNTFSAPTGTPPTVGSAFAGGTLLFNAPGNGTYNHTGLDPVTTYYYRAYSYNGCSYSTGLSAQATTPCAATLNPQAFTATAVSLSQINLGYTANAANNNTIIVFNTTNTFSAPTGTPPTVGSAFAGGTLLFNAPGNGTYNHTGLNSVTIYYYRAYSYNGCSYSSGLSAQATTLCAPSTQATNFTASNINSPLIGNATLNWTRGDGTNVLVVMRANGAVNANPQSGTPYTANPAFGTGQQIGTGNFVVFNGPSTTSTVNISNLVLGTTYHVAIYEYNSTGICYLIPALTGNFVVNVGITYLFVSGTWIPSDPNGVSSAADNISVLLGNAIINTNTLINNVTVNEFSALTVMSSTVLTVNGSLNMQSSNLNYSSLMAEGTIVGTIRYNRHVNAGPGIGVGAGANDLISSPLVSSQNFGAFASANPNIRFDTRTPPTGDPNTKVFGPFDKASGTYLLWNSVADAGNGIISGVGYRAASTDNLGFTFTGSVNQGIVTNDIQYSGPQFISWNLVGNPYPSYINVGNFLTYVLYADPGTDRTLDVRNVDILSPSAAAVYGYDGDASDGYTIWNLATPTRNITPGQGFLVSAKQSAVALYNLTFAPSMRVIGNTDDFIPGRSSNTNNSHVRLQAAMGTGTYKTDFYFNDNSTSGLDIGYDASVFNNQAAPKAIYSRLVQNSTGIDMAIQSLAYSSLGSEIIVPLGINANSGQQVSVSIAESDLPSNIEVYLEDTVTGTFTLLNSSDYTFTPTTTLNSPGRFFLRFSQSTLSSPEKNGSSLQIYATSTPRTLFVKGELTAATTITLYDTLGRQVLASNLNAGSTSNNVDVSSLSTGVYVVKLNNALQQKTEKIILK